MDSDTDCDCENVVHHRKSITRRQHESGTSAKLMDSDTPRERAHTNRRQRSHSISRARIRRPSAVATSTGRSPRQLRNGSAPARRSGSSSAGHFCAACHSGVAQSSSRVLFASAPNSRSWSPSSGSAHCAAFRRTFPSGVAPASSSKRVISSIFALGASTRPNGKREFWSCDELQKPVRLSRESSGSNEGNKTGQALPMSRSDGASSCGGFGSRSEELHLEDAKFANLGERLSLSKIISAQTWSREPSEGRVMFGSSRSSRTFTAFTFDALTAL